MQVRRCRSQAVRRQASLKSTPSSAQRIADRVVPLTIASPRVSPAGKVFFLQEDMHPNVWLTVDGSGDDCSYGILLLSRLCNFRGKTESGNASSPLLTRVPVAIGESMRYRTPVCRLFRCCPALTCYGLCGQACSRRCSRSGCGPCQLYRKKAPRPSSRRANF